MSFYLPHQLDHEILWLGVKGLRVNREVTMLVAHHCVCQNAITDESYL